MKVKDATKEKMLDNNTEYGQIAKFHTLEHVKDNNLYNKNTRKQ